MEAANQHLIQLQQRGRLWQLRYANYQACTCLSAFQTSMKCRDISCTQVSYCPLCNPRHPWADMGLLSTKDARKAGGGPHSALAAPKRPALRRPAQREPPSAAVDDPAAKRQRPENGKVISAEAEQWYARVASPLQ